VRTRIRRPASLALLGFGVLDAAGYSVIVPVTPAIAAATGTGPALIGALVASFPATMLVGYALAGAGIRRQRPTVVLAGSLALLALGSLGFALGAGLPAWFAARLVMGLGSGGLWIAITFATLEHWPGREYQGMSRLYAAYSVGGLVGPALGAIGGVRGPFLAYLGLVVLAMPLVVAVGTPPRRRRFETDRSALRLPGFWLACVGVLFAILALGIIEGVLPLRLAGWFRQAQIGWMFTGMALLLAASAVLAGRVAPTRAVGAGVVLVPAGVAVAGAAGTAPLFLAGLAVAAVGVGAGETGATGVLLESVAPERIVTAMVLWSAIGIVGYLAGPVVGGAVAQAFGYPALGLVPLAVAVALLAAFRGATRARRATPLPGCGGRKRSPGRG
jgi:MFS family permease